MRSLPLCTLLTALTLNSCLEREESITVHADGSIDVVHTWQGDTPDFDGGEARLPSAPRWRVARGKVKDDEGNEKTRIVATASFASAAELPHRFGRHDDPLAREALHFSTSLDLDEGEGRTTYRFHRRFAARHWADDRFLHSRYFDDIEDLTHGDFDDLALDDKRVVVDRLVRHELAVLQLRGERVMERFATKSAPAIEARLAVRDAVTRAFHEVVDLSQALALAEGPAERILSVTEQLHTRVTSAIVTAVVANATDRGTGAIDVRTAVETLRHDREVTQDLSDEDFIVRLDLPGTVTQHNADAVDGTTLIWRFSGKNLADRDHELLAISVL